MCLACAILLLSASFVPVSFANTRYLLYSFTHKVNDELKLSLSSVSFFFLVWFGRLFVVDSSCFFRFTFSFVANRVRYDRAFILGDSTTLSRDAAS